jgi:hypothetical protein
MSLLGRTGNGRPGATTCSEACDPIDMRPGFAVTLERIEGNGVPGNIHYDHESAVRTRLLS